MSFTNRWRTTIPSSVVKVNQVDDHIRRLRVDIDERMDGEGVDWSADPITTTANRYQYVPWSGFKINTVAGATANLAITDGGLSSAAAQTFTMRSPILAVRGGVIDALHLSCAVGANGSIPWALVQINTTGAPAETVVSSGTVAAATSQGNQALATSIAHTIDATASNYMYYFVYLTFTQTAASGGPIIQGLRIKYTISSVMTRV